MRAASGCLAFGLAMVVAIGAGAAHAADRPQPGLWEVITKHERGGVGRTEPAKQRCITAEQAKNFGSRDAIPAGSRNGMTCKLADWQSNPDGVSWRIACSGAMTAEQSGRYVFDTAQHFTTTMTTTVSTPGRERVSVLTIESRRIGECPK